MIEVTVLTGDKLPKILAANQNMDIEFYTCPAEDIEYPETIAKWEEEHTQMMLKEAPETFNILHYVSYVELKVKK